MNKVRYFWGWALLVVFWAFYSANSLSLLTFARSQDLVMGDIVDQLRIVQGLERAKTFSDTLVWWYGSWAESPQVNFYRPLTSLLWWIQLHLFGGREQAAFGFTLVHLSWHLGACVLLMVLLRRLIGDRLALLSVFIWGGCLAAYVTLPTPRWAIDAWRDDPDMTVSCCILWCLSALLSHWQTGKNKYLAWTVVALLVAISFKEMSYITPLLAGLMCWFLQSEKLALTVKQRIKTVTLLFGVVAAAFVFRLWALQGYGFRFGTNGSWFSRWVLYCFGGRPASLLLNGLFGSVAVALWGFILVALLRRRYVLAGGFAIVSFGLIFASDHLMGIEWMTFYQIITPFPLAASTLYQDVPVALVLMVLWVSFIKYRDRMQVFGYGWLLLAYVPLLTAPITEHALYLPSVGWAIWLAVGLERFANQGYAALKAANHSRLLSTQPTPLPEARGN